MEEIIKSFFDFLEEKEDKKDLQYLMYYNSQAGEEIREWEGDIKTSYPEFFKYLPNLKTVKGSVILYTPDVSHVTGGLSVYGNFNLSFTRVRQLEHLRVGGNLNLHSSLLSSMPHHCTVEGNMDLTRTPLAREYERGVKRFLRDWNNNHNTLKGKLYL